MPASLAESEQAVALVEKRSPFVKFLNFCVQNLFLVLLSVGLFLLLFQTWRIQASCNPMINWGGDRCPIASISLTPRTLTLDIGKSKTIEADIKIKSTAQNKRGANNQINWISSNKNIASITVLKDAKAQKAQVTGVYPGSATIAVTSTKDSTKQDHIPVIVKGIDTIKLHPHDLIIQVGKTGQIMPEIIQFGGISEKVNWHSANETIATISSDGIVKGIAEGQTKVEATSQYDGKKQATATITVQTQVAINHITIIPTNFDSTTVLWEGDAYPLAVDVEGVGANANDVTWASSNPNIALIQGQGHAVRLRAIAPGDVKIIATSNQDVRKKDKRQLVVSPSEVIRVSLPIEQAQFNVNDSAKLCPQVEGHGSVNKDALFESSNPAIATVDSSGQITALTKGEATITATSQQDQTKDASLQLKVPKDVSWWAVVTGAVIAAGSMAVGVPPPAAVAIGIAAATGVQTWQGSHLPGC